MNTKTINMNIEDLQKSVSLLVHYNNRLFMQHITYNLKTGNA